MNASVAPALTETEFDSGLRLIRGQGIVHDFARHAHRSLLFVLITVGMREIDVQQQSIRVHAGQAFCLPPDCPHACRSFAPHDYHAISVPETLWRDLQCEDAALPAFVIFDQDSAGLRALQALITVLQLDADPMAIESALLSLQAVIQPGTLTPHPPKQRAMVQQVSVWLQEHYTEPVRLADLTALTGWRAGMVNRVFREHMGVPPYEFLLHQRLREVARLLRSGEWPLADIAAETGFADQSHMQRLFRRAFGVTPNSYRMGASQHLRPKPEAG
ncbi:MAG: AraC family transcriptional regulator [Burkholderiaceae bacterium]|nr:AraC family transcriptional regulator [Burkholderiaceae bacterium]